MLSSSGPLTLIKLALLSLATALARSVLPHPGGPHSNTPHGALSPRRRNTSGRRMGRTMLMRISSRTAVRAPRSSQVTSGTVVKPSRWDEGWTMLRARTKSALVRAMEESWSAVREVGCARRKAAMGRVAREGGRVENGRDGTTAASEGAAGGASSLGVTVPGVGAADDPSSTATAAAGSSCCASTPAISASSPAPAAVCCCCKSPRAPSPVANSGRSAAAPAGPNCSKMRLTAMTPAAPVKALKSAPTYPGVCLAKSA